MTSENPSIEEVVRAYAEFNSSPSSENEWSSGYLIELTLDGEWVKVWDLIQAFTAEGSNPSDSLLAVVAAGPLEDLLSKAGLEYIDKVELLAQTNPIFTRALTGVWKSSIEPSVWDRVTTICRKAPNPIDGHYAF